MSNVGPLSDDELVHQQRQRALAIAAAILRDRVGPTYGSRLLSRCQGKLGLKAEKEFTVLSPFISLDSETDHLPFGNERKLWAPEALLRVDAEIAHFDTLTSFDVKSACRRLTEELAPLVPGQVEELDVVEVLMDIVDECYIAEGTRGTVVHVYIDPGLAYEVEFCDEDGQTKALLTMLPHQVRVVWKATG